MLPLCLSVLVILYNSHQFRELHFHPLTSHLLCRLRSDEILKTACGVMGLQHASVDVQKKQEKKEKKKKALGIICFTTVERLSRILKKNVSLFD